MNNDMPNGLKTHLQLQVDVAVEYSSGIKLPKSAMARVYFHNRFRGESTGPRISGSGSTAGAPTRAFNTRLHVYSLLVVHMKYSNLLAYLCRAN